MRRPALTASFSLSMFLSMALVSGASARAAELDSEEPVARPANVLRTPPPAPAERTWYGWQIMLADAASFLCVGATEHGACLAGYALSGPAVHTLHGNPGRGLASLGMRVGLPITGALIGNLAANCPERQPSVTTTREVDGATVTTTTGGWDFCGLGQAAFGALAGAATAMVLDGIMAFSDRAPEPTPESRQSSRFAITPRLAVGQNNLAMGLSGTF